MNTDDRPIAITSFNNKDNSFHQKGVPFDRYVDMGYVSETLMYGNKSSISYTQTRLNNDTNFFFCETSNTENRVTFTQPS